MTPRRLPRQTPPPLVETREAYHEGGFDVLGRPVSREVRERFAHLAEQRTALDVNTLAIEFDRVLPGAPDGWVAQSVGLFLGDEVRVRRPAQFSTLALLSPHIARHRRIHGETVRERVLVPRQMLRTGLRFDVSRLALMPSDRKLVRELPPVSGLAELAEGWRLYADDPADVGLLFDAELRRDMARSGISCELYANGGEVVVFTHPDRTPTTSRLLVEAVDRAIERAEARIRAGQHDGRVAEPTEDLFDTSADLPTVGDGSLHAGAFADKSWAWVGPLSLFLASLSLLALAALVGLLAAVTFTHSAALGVMFALFALGAGVPGAVVAGMGAKSAVHAFSPVPGVPLTGAPTLFLRDPQLREVAPIPPNVARRWRISGAPRARAGGSTPSRGIRMRRVGTTVPLPTTLVVSASLDQAAPDGLVDRGVDPHTGLRTFSKPDDPLGSVMTPALARTIQRTLGAGAVVAMKGQEIVFGSSTPVTPEGWDELSAHLLRAVVRWSRDPEVYARGALDEAAQSSVLASTRTDRAEGTRPELASEAALRLEASVGVGTPEAVEAPRGSRSEGEAPVAGALLSEGSSDADPDGDHPDRAAEPGGREFAGRARAAIGGLPPIPSVDVVPGSEDAAPPEVFADLPVPPSAPAEPMRADDWFDGPGLSVEASGAPSVGRRDLLGPERAGDPKDSNHASGDPAAPGAPAPLEPDPEALRAERELEAELERAMAVLRAQDAAAGRRVG